MRDQESNLYWLKSLSKLQLEQSDRDHDLDIDRMNCIYELMIWGYTEAEAEAIIDRETTRAGISVRTLCESVQALGMSFRNVIEATKILAAVSVDKDVAARYCAYERQQWRECTARQTARARQATHHSQQMQQHHHNRARDKLRQRPASRAIPT